MSVILFTKEQIEYLKTNKYVKHVSEKGITYTKEFKEYFINEYNKGLFPIRIFENAGLSKSILGNKRIESSGKRFRAYSQRLDGFKDNRKGKSGRPRTKHLSVDDKLKLAEEKIKYLQQENEFLKKIQRVERQVKKKYQ